MASATFALTDILIRGRQTNIQVIVSGVPFHRDNKYKGRLIAGYCGLCIEICLDNEMKHQYLLKTSCHQNHTKKAIPFSLFLRIHRICSTDTFFDQRSRELIEYLTKRGYSRTSLQRDANRVRSIPRHATLQPQEQKIRQDSPNTLCHMHILQPCAS